MIFWALLFADIMLPGLRVRTGVEEKSARNRDAMMGDLAGLV